MHIDKRPRAQDFRRLPRNVNGVCGFSVVVPLPSSTVSRKSNPQRQPISLKFGQHLRLMHIDKRPRAQDFWRLPRNANGVGRFSDEVALATSTVRGYRKGKVPPYCYPIKEDSRLSTTTAAISLLLFCAFFNPFRIHPTTVCQYIPHLG